MKLILDLSVLDSLIPVSMRYESVSGSIVPSGGDDTDQNGIVELLASFASLKFLIELVLNTHFTTLSTTPRTIPSIVVSTAMTRLDKTYVL